MKHTLKEIVKGTTANFSHVCNGIVVYLIKVGDTTYQLEMDSTDPIEHKNMYFNPTYKAITLMRWIRKAIENDNHGYPKLTEF
mgnify:CR=1 FL=1